MGYTQWGAISTSHNQKSGRFYWMGARIVEVRVPQMKVGREGGKPPAGHKRRRGCRSHRGGTRASRVGRSTGRKGAQREVCNLAAIPPPRPGNPKSESLRVMNHKLRKNLWAAKAANRLARTAGAKRLIRNFPSGAEDLRWSDFRSQLRLSVTSGRRAAVMHQFRLLHSRWVGVFRRCKELGIHPLFGVSTSLLKFLAIRSPSCGDWGSLLGELQRERFFGFSPEFTDCAHGGFHRWCTECGGCVWRPGAVCAACRAVGGSPPSRRRRR